jgi:hypothetical protein
MRFFVSGPRIFGVRPCVVFDPIQRLSPKQSEPIGSFVYVIHGTHNLVKIGITTNPAARIAQIRTGSGFPIDFSYVGYVQSGAESIERDAHAALARQRCAGEWFDTTPERAIAAITRAASAFGVEIMQCDPSSDDADYQSVRLTANRGGTSGLSAAGYFMVAVRTILYSILSFVIMAAIAIYFGDSEKQSSFFEHASFVIPFICAVAAWIDTKRRWL